MYIEPFLFLRSFPCMFFLSQMAIVPGLLGGALIPVSTWTALHWWGNCVRRMDFIPFFQKLINLQKRYATVNIKVNLKIMLKRNLRTQGFWDLILLLAFLGHIYWSSLWIVPEPVNTLDEYRPKQIQSYIASIKLQTSLYSFSNFDSSTLFVRICPSISLRFSFSSVKGAAHIASIV